MGPQGPSLLLDQFGPLQGVRVLSTGTIVAEPVAAGMAAEMGAEVIHIERPGRGEDWRHAEFPIDSPTGEEIASSWVQDRRNTYYTTLDFSTPEGRGSSSISSSAPISGWRVPRHAPTTSGGWMTWPY